MHRDKRLGLAMGLLIVAIVGAFFFRVQPSSHDGIPEMAQQENIDNIISEMPAGPYLAGLEDDTSPIQQAEKHRFSQNVPEWNEIDIQGSRSQLAKTEQQHSTGLPSPDPIKPLEKMNTFSVSHRRIKNKAKIFQEDSITKHDTSGEFQLPAMKLSADKESFPPRTETFKMDGLPTTDQRQATIKARPYRVKEGDTLERLAEKYLGDKKRYPEIFRLNQNKLHSPDDLRSGMLIRLPLYPRISTHQPETFLQHNVLPESHKPLKNNYHLTIESDKKPTIPSSIAQPRRIPQPEKNPTPIQQWPFRN